MSHGRTAARMGIVLILAATGCKKEAPPPAAPPALNAVVVHTADFAFHAPDTVPSGWTRIRLVNGGPSLHHAQLIRINEGKTFDSLMAAMRNPGPPPSWIKEVAGPNAPAPGDTSETIVNLEAGHYALVCFIPDSLNRPHVSLGMSKALEVTAATGAAAAEPTADLEIKLTDYTFTESAPLTAGRHTIKVTNDAAQSHEIFFAKLDSNATAQQLVQWAARMRGRPPAAPAGGTTALAPGSHVYLVMNLTPGNYAVLCFVPDSKDGKMHVEHGMVRQITVN